MRRFQILFLAITALSHLLFASGLAFALGHVVSPLVAWLVALVIAAPLGYTVRSRVSRARGDAPIPKLRLWLWEEPYYAHWCATVLAMLLFVPAAPVAFALGEPLGAAALGCYVVTLILSIYGIVVRRRWVRVRELDVPIAGLPGAFDGYRIAQLSDLHIGGLWPREQADRWIRQLRALDVDLVALTGDYVTRGDAFHDDIAAVLAQMSGRDGAFAVMGNHDYFGDGEHLVEVLRAKGIPVLRNERAFISKAGSRLEIAGVEDTWTERDDVDLTMRGRDPEIPLIALAHDPRLFPALASRGAALVLSGHTHWGQIALPFFASRVNPSRLSYRYHAGVYREGASMLYVNPGLGTTGPPMRLGAAPEITVFRLRPAAPR